MGAVGGPNYIAVLADDINVVRIRLASMLQAIEDMTVTQTDDELVQNLAHASGYVVSMGVIWESMSNFLVECGLMRETGQMGGTNDER